VLGTGLRSIFKRVLPSLREAYRASVASTQVANAAEPAPENAKAGTKHRFKRTAAEIQLGLTIEEAKARRVAEATLAPKEQVKTKPVKTHEPVENKAKRFRRTRKEIRLGLSIEEAAARRGVALPKQERKIYVERKDVEPLKTTDLIDTLSPKIQVRARAMTHLRSRGHKGAITTEMLDQVAAAVAAGQVTKCPPGIDSDGYDHFHQRETR
jgi:hypothetical protein